MPAASGAPARYYGSAHIVRTLLRAHIEGLLSGSHLCNACVVRSGAGESRQYPGTPGESVRSDRSG